MGEIRLNEGEEFSTQVRRLCQTVNEQEEGSNCEVVKDFLFVDSFFERPWEMTAISPPSSPFLSLPVPCLRAKKGRMKIKERRRNFYFAS